MHQWGVIRRVCLRPPALQRPPHADLNLFMNASSLRGDHNFILRGHFLSSQGFSIYAYKERGEETCRCAPLVEHQPDSIHSFCVAESTENMRATFAHPTRGGSYTPIWNAPKKSYGGYMNLHVWCSTVVRAASVSTNVWRGHRSPWVHEVSSLHWNAF